MATGMVQEMNPSRSGASMRLKINGRWLVAGNRVNLDGVQKGSSVEYEEGSFAGQDGKPIPCINRIRPAPQANGHGAAPSTVPKSCGLDEASLRFISNVVGSALAAGKIETPIQVAAWVRAARKALAQLSKPEPEFDDELPEDFYTDPQPPSQPAASDDPGW